MDDGGFESKQLRPRRIRHQIFIHRDLIFCFLASSCFSFVFLDFRVDGDSTHVRLHKIDTVRDVRPLVVAVHHETFVHRADERHLDLSVHHVGESGGRELHAEHQEQQEGELKANPGIGKRRREGSSYSRH